MNRGLIIKAFRESWRATLAFGLGLAVVEVMLAYVLPTYQEQFTTIWDQLEFVRNLVSALLGVDVSEGMGPEVFGKLA